MRKPKHIAIIMDGNGRWARERGLPRAEGHRIGRGVVLDLLKHCSKIGIEQLTLYAFSNENWKRPKEEVDALMFLLKESLIRERERIVEDNIRFSIIGRREGIPDDVLAEMDESVRIGRENTGLRVCIAINYGARSEIVDAVRSIVREGIAPGAIDEECISNRLYTAGTPDPDLLIRTAGEMRLSNYLLWQLSYTEIWITKTLWPDFTPELLDEAIRDYCARERRFGGL